jgi:hypothetical protein
LTGSDAGRSAHGGPSETRPSDAEAGFTVDADFRRFNQKNDVFCRSFWDPTVKSGRSGLF